MEKNPEIIERIESMDEETAKSRLWLFLQYTVKQNIDKLRFVVKNTKCVECKSKCKEPILDCCMMRVLDEVEAIEDAKGHKAADSVSD